MLALVAAGGAQLDAGSVGLALARRWCEAGEQVLFVDADAAGSRLAQRLGETDRAEYSPAARGLPSLMVAREPITLRLLAGHCYNLGTSEGSLWALFAPSHPAGARHAAVWLAQRASDLRAVDNERRVIVSASLQTGDGDGLLAPLLAAASIVAVLAPVESAERAAALRAQCGDAGLVGAGHGLGVLVVEGDPPLGDDRIAAGAGMPVAGRLPVVADERVLRLQGGRRDRALAGRLEKISGRLLEACNLAASAAWPPRPAEAAPRPEAAPGPEPATGPGRIPPVPAWDRPRRLEGRV